MANTVTFRGPMLFITKGKIVDRVLIPDAHTELADGHPDKTTAKQHHAGLLILESDGATEVLRTTLYGKHVTIRAGNSSDRPEKDTDFSAKMIQMHRLLTKTGDSRVVALKPDNDPRVAAVVQMKGGAVTVSQVTKQKYFFPTSKLSPTPKPGDHPIGMLIEWQTNKATKITIEKPGSKPPEELEIRLKDQQMVYIYNFDPPQPDKAALEEDAPCEKKGQELQDYDFKWLYQLLKHKDDDWDKVVDPNETLPAAHIKCPPEKGKDPIEDIPPRQHPDTSSCFGGEWCDGSDTQPEECG